MTSSRYIYYCDYVITLFTLQSVRTRCGQVFGPFSFRMNVNRLDRAHHNSHAARLKQKQVLFFQTCRAQYNLVSVDFKGELRKPVHAEDRIRTMNEQQRYGLQTCDFYVNEA